MQFTNVKKLLSAAIVMSLGITSTSVPVHATQNIDLSNNISEISQCIDGSDRDHTITDSINQDNSDVEDHNIIIPEKMASEKVVFVPDGTPKSAVNVIRSAESELVLSDNTMDVYAADLTKSEIRKIENRSEDVIIEDNIVFSASEEDKLWVTEDQLKDAEPENPDWNLEMISSSMQEQRTASGDGEHVKVAVLDSGVEWISDVELKGDINLVQGEQDLAEYMNDMTGHGTAVASIIASINPNADIYSVRILDLDNKTTLERLIRGIYWCIDNKMDVINISLGATQSSEILKYAIDEAESHGITIVASAGNENKKGVEYPAAYENVISVGSVDNHAEKSDFSAVGREVDVVAPGENILVQSCFGMYTWADGTSMAAPHVTAEASLILEKDSSKSSDFVKGLIKETAKNLGEEE